MLRATTIAKIFKISITLNTGYIFIGRFKKNRNAHNRRWDPTKPNKIPIAAPIIPIITDSVKNMVNIILLVPPNAFNIPISLVRSITEVYIVIMIPNDPTIRENTAMLEIKVEIPTMNFVNVFIISKEFNIET